MERFLRAERRQQILIAALLIPVAWSAAASAWTVVPGPLWTGNAKASLAFDQYLVNLREVGLQPILQGTYAFKNVGTEPLTITRLDPSCGCLSPKMAGDQRTYQPGERGYFVVGVATANEAPGPHTYTINVHYEDPQPREAAVRFKLKLPVRKVTVEPRELAFYQYDGKPQSATVYVTDYRGHEIGVTQAVFSTTDLIEVNVQEPEVDEYGNSRVPIVLQVPGTVPPGRTVGMLAIETTDPEFAKIRIPVLVDGPSRSVRRSDDLIGPPPR